MTSDIKGAKGSKFFPEHLLGFQKAAVVPEHLSWSPEVTLLDIHEGGGESPT